MRKTVQRKIARPEELTEWDIRLQAWHEAGHAVCSRFAPEQEKVTSVSILPDASACGATRTAGRKRRNVTRNYCLGKIAVLLAGRLSEEMFLDEVTSSCVHDLEQARHWVMQMVGVYGMGAKTGKFSCHCDDDGNWLLFSDRQKDDFYEDVQSILMDAEAVARQILQQHEGNVRRLAEELLQKKMLSGTELDRILR